MAVPTLRAAAGAAPPHALHAPPRAPGPARSEPAVRRHEIPTHLNVEDRALLGLTMRQVMFLLFGCAAAYWLWSQWPDAPSAVRAAAAAAGLAGAALVALVRPCGRALEEWAFVAARYAAVPKAAGWRTGECQLSPTRSSGRDREVWR